jgi:hypothetical protein
MSTERDPARRESPVKGPALKPDGIEATGNATQEKSAGRDPRQEIARQNDDRDIPYTIRSHKSIRRLTGSPDRTDSREQVYSALDAWPGQSHE